MVARFLRWTLCCVSLAIAGCSGSTQGPPQAAGRAALARVVEAYGKTQDHLKRPPRNLEELRPHLGGSADELLRSPEDGEPYVILWDVDVRTPSLTGSTLPLFIYERKGTNGRRFAADVMLGLPHLTEAEFRAASFARGHKPAP